MAKTITKIKLHGTQVKSWPLHFPSERQRNAIGVNCPFGTLCVTLHCGLSLVPGFDGFEQSVVSPLKMQDISTLSDVIGGHISKNINI